MKKSKFRSCGPCTACCDVGFSPFAIPKCSIAPDGILKLEDEVCPHLVKDKGCGVYKERPTNPCKQYHCLWQIGFGKGSWRPDKVGIVVDMTDKPHVKETRQEALDTSTGREILREVERLATDLGTNFALHRYGPKEYDLIGRVAKTVSRLEAQRIAILLQEGKVDEFERQAHEILAKA